MPGAKKDGKIVNFYLDKEVVKLLEQYCMEAGLSKTVAIERFIKACTKARRTEKAE